MAETMNYRMNLVIDPKNVIKANRELRAMERYFERIQGRVLRIGRTRMAPEIVLKDRASKGLDNLLRKLQRVRSEVVNASGTVTLKVKHEKAKQKHDNKGTQEQTKGKKIALKAPPMPKIVLVFPDFTPIVQAMNLNSLASTLNSRLLDANSGHLSELAKALSSIQIGGASGAKEEEKPKSFWEKFKSGVDFTTSAVSTVKGVKDTKNSWKDLKKNWDDQDPISGNTRREKVTNTVKKLWTNKGKVVDLASSLADTLEGGTGVADSVMGFFSGGGSSSASSGIISNTANQVGGSGSGVLGKMLKGGLKRSLGIASVAMDAVSIANAKPGKERAEAIGSAAGGTIGSVLGGAVGSLIPIPVVGTAIGSAVGGAVGDFVGGKIGGFIADSAPKISNWFSKNILGKKDKPKEKEDVSKKPDVITAPYNPEKKPVLQNAPYNPSNPPAVHTAPLIQGPSLPPYPPSFPYYQSYHMGMGMASPQNPNMAGPGPRMQSAVTNNATSAGGKMPQVVQISPEQMTTLSGFLRDMKTETTTQYNLPPGAVQVTVHEEYPVDVEGIIQQVGQRLRAEFAKATQNRKPQSMALA
ncbi:hypothetical protein RJP21_20435 [Paenibacillus sp. VCA1]|uniref:hypothetical protein n=1 Tax=Paenibacillus sp. VCA1 TaxID=3039148 RepID=UPI0028724ADE|nr:hypothetical protein [Paenibacillus sp. VCA1]MDR9855977.1 hypothetical protein [Paenibacillus sp. VCA1]